MRSPEHLNQFRLREWVYGTSDRAGVYGFFYIPSDKNKCVTLACMSSAGDVTGWEHVSVVAHYRNKDGKRGKRTPTWEEMVFVKDLFWPPEETVIQFHPPHSEYVNNHPHCLHLWKQVGMTIALPPSNLVGIK